MMTRAGSEKKEKEVKKNGSFITIQENQSGLLNKTVFCILWYYVYM